MIDWINPVATLVASFSGAWVAFKLHALEKAKDVRRKNITAINRAILTLMQQANTLKLYQFDQIDPHRENPGRHFLIQATLPFDLESLRFDFKELDFFESTEDQQLIFDLSVEERKFIETLKAINTRSNLIQYELEPKLEAAGFLDGGEYSGSDFKAAIGQPLYKKIERLTDDVILHVDETQRSIFAMKSKILSHAKARFPKAKFVDFVFPDIKLTS